MRRRVSCAASTRSVALLPSSATKLRERSLPSRSSTRRCTRPTPPPPKPPIAAAKIEARKTGSASESSSAVRSRRNRRQSLAHRIQAVPKLKASLLVPQRAAGQGQEHGLEGGQLLLDAEGDARAREARARVLVELDARVGARGRALSALQLGQRALRHRTAGVEDHDAVAQALDLAQLVRGVDQRQALRVQALDHL